MFVILNFVRIISSKLIIVLNYLLIKLKHHYHYLELILNYAIFSFLYFKPLVNFFNYLQTTKLRIKASYYKDWLSFGFLYICNFFSLLKYNMSFTNILIVIVIRKRSLLYPLCLHFLQYTNRCLRS